MRAEAGSVTNQATITFFAIFHRTADNRLEEATPKMLAVMVWVVLIGIPKWPAVRMTAALEVSAAKPCTGSKRLIF